MYWKVYAASKSAIANGSASDESERENGEKSTAVTIIMTMMTIEWSNGDLAIISIFSQYFFFLLLSHSIFGVRCQWWRNRYFPIHSAPSSSICQHLLSSALCRCFMKSLTFVPISSNFLCLFLLLFVFLMRSVKLGLLLRLCDFAAICQCDFRICLLIIRKKSCWPTEFGCPCACVWVRICCWHHYHHQRHRPVVFFAVIMVIDLPRANIFCCFCAYQWISRINPFDMLCAHTPAGSIERFVAVFGS